MSTRDIDTQKSKLFQEISQYDTISQFMEKCNNNFAIISAMGGGPAGVEGDKGDQGIPTKPKVPIHVWTEGKEYDSEITIFDNCELIGINVDLTSDEYKDGHLIMLQNAHVYILEVDIKDNFTLKPKYVFGLQSYDNSEIIDGKNAYVHIAYSHYPDGTDFKTLEDLQKENNNTEPVSTFNLRRDSGVSDSSSSALDMPYMGIYSDNTKEPSPYPNRYTWIKIQGSIGLSGEKGERGEKGEKGDPGEKGDGYTGQAYYIDLEGNMSTISIDVDRTVLYDNNDDYCKCTLHAYYGKENVKLSIHEVKIFLPSEYSYVGNDIVLTADKKSKVGQIIKEESNNDVVINFIPDANFVFPEKTISFQIHVETSVEDNTDGQIYDFTRDTMWMIKGIVSTFELEIVPQYRTIKLFEDGEYYPKTLLVNVYKVEDSKRNTFDLIENTDFKLLYKNINNNNWKPYPTNGVNTEGVSCLEFKVVRYHNTDSEEIWDMENVWTVSDGKGAHYYHADLGATESMMILTTGEKINIGTDDDPKYCAEFRNESKYSITFDPKFYYGTEELDVIEVNIGTNSGEEYYQNKTFDYELINSKETKNGIEIIKSSTLNITNVPYGVEMIPMNISVTANYPKYDNFGKFVKNEQKIDIISFNVYITTLSNTYSLLPTVSSYNTSTGKDKDTIGCDVYKNATLIPLDELEQNGLTLKYIVHDGGTSAKSPIIYEEPLVYGDDNDANEDEFSAKDVAIEFILEYRGKDVVKSIVPLVKDGIDGKDGDTWQYIFCKSPKYPFDRTGISNPSDWVDDKPNDINNELICDDNWYDDHVGVDSENKYEYQSYRRWDKNNKCWSKYGNPTLYSNYSKNGSGYSVMLSNPIAVIPVGDDWSVNKNLSIQDDFTLVYLYDNISDLSSNDNITISLSDDNVYVQKGHFSVDKVDGVNKIIFKPVVADSTFTFNPNTQYKLPILLTYNLGEDIDGDDNVDKFETTVNWTLSPIQGLQDVEVFVDKKVVNTSIAKTHSLKVGYYLISSNETKKFIGNHDEGNTKGYQIKLTDDIGDLSSDAISNWNEATYDFVEGGHNRNCYVVLIDSNGSIVDYTNVTAINDGNEGKPAIHLELTKDYIALPCSANGAYVHPDYNDVILPIRSTMMLYSGDKLIEDYPNITYSFKIDGKSTSKILMIGSGSFDIPKDIVSGDTNIECIATYNGESFHKTLFIDLEETPYVLELNKNVLSRDVNIGEITDGSLMARVKYWMNGEWVYTNDGVVKATTYNIPNTFTLEIPNEDIFDRVLVIDNSTLKSNTEDTEIRISYYSSDESTNEVTYQIVGIVNNGKNGTAPSCAGVKILGYSIYEDADIDAADEWVSSINELENITSNQPIYILNEYTWSDGSVTKGVTVTLAGTQGVDGKSRVLFYLGSFEDGTLTGTTVNGILDDERCDYYIDMYGNAWMRSGSANSASGSAAGNSSNQNWKASTKVGFLNAGAIHADMINTNTITANSAIVSTLFSQEIVSNKLKVTEANIDGLLTASVIDTTELKVDAANISGKLNANEIDASELTVSAANITGTLSGNTIQSNNNVKLADNTTGPSWKIGEYGDGWFANKNIFWDTEGNMTIGDLGSFTNNGDCNLNKYKIDDTEVITMIWSGDDTLSFDNLCSKSITFGTNKKYYTNYIGGYNVWKNLSSPSNTITDDTNASITSVLYINNTKPSGEHVNKNGFLGEFYIENDGCAPIWIRNHVNTQYPMFLDDPNGIISKKLSTSTSTENISKLAILIPSKTIFKFILHSIDNKYYRIVPISNLEIYRWGGGRNYGDNITTLKPYVVSNCEDRYYPTGSSYQFQAPNMGSEGWLGQTSYGTVRLNIPISRSNSCKHKGASFFINTYPNIFSATGLTPSKEYSVSSTMRYVYSDARTKGLVFCVEPKRDSLEYQYVPIDQDSRGYEEDFESAILTSRTKKRLSFTAYNSSGSSTTSPLQISKIKMSDDAHSGNMTGSQMGATESYYSNRGEFWQVVIPEPKTEDQEFTEVTLRMQIAESLLYLIYKNGVRTINFNIGIGDENGKCISEFTIPVSITD